MIRCVLLSVLAVSMGLLSGCGASPGDVATTHSGISETRGEDGVLRRSSVGREGHARDLAYFRQRLRALEASPGADQKLTAGVAEIVARLAEITVEPSTLDLQEQKEGYVCGANYWLTAEAYVAMTSGSSTAQAAYTEFGPPSPWRKGLYTYAYAAGGTIQQQVFYGGSFSGPGTYSVPTAYAETGPDFCPFLIAYSYIDAHGCPNGFVSAYAENPGCP